MRYPYRPLPCSGAHAEGCDYELMRGFTFDHTANGIVAGCRRDNKELCLIRVEDSVVVEEILRPADQRYVDYPPLAYEALADAEEARRSRPRPRLRKVD